MQKWSSEVICKKKVFLKILQTSQENTCVGVFFNKVAGLQAADFFRKGSNTEVSCEVCETFKNTYFEEHLQTTASKAFYKKAVLKNFAIFTGRKYLVIRVL